MGQSRQLDHGSVDTSSGSPPPLSFAEFKRRTFCQTNMSAAHRKYPGRFAPDIADHGHAWFNRERRAKQVEAGFENGHDHLPVTKSPLGSMDIEASLYAADCGLGHLLSYEHDMLDFQRAFPDYTILPYYGSLDGDRLKPHFDIAKASQNWRTSRWNGMVDRCLEEPMAAVGPRFWLGIDASTTKTGVKREKLLEIQADVVRMNSRFAWEAWPNRAQADAAAYYLVIHTWYKHTAAHGWHAPMSAVGGGLRMITEGHETPDDAARALGEVFSADPKWDASIGLYRLIEAGMTARQLYTLTRRYMV